jgi:hypothetical protein
MSKSSKKITPHGLAPEKGKFRSVHIQTWRDPVAFGEDGQPVSPIQTFVHKKGYTKTDPSARVDIKTMFQRYVRHPEEFQIDPNSYNEEGVDPMLMDKFEKIEFARQTIADAKATRQALIDRQNAAKEVIMKPSKEDIADLLPDAKTDAED